MTRSSGPRKTANLSESIHHQLNMYALAAGAAGVSLVALAQLAEAKIVYTSSHIHINPKTGTVWLDLNHDGIRDFRFNAASLLTHSGFFRSSLVVTPVQQPNRVWAVHTNHGYTCAAALPPGSIVGPRSPFQPRHSHMTMARASGETSVGSATLCPWVHVSQAYLGLKFVVGGKIHFGWARVKMVAGLGFPAVITGYAYETTPFKAIVTGKGPEDESGVQQLNPSSLTAPTPETAPLGLLALGSPGLSIWRRKESVGATQ